MGPKGGIDMSRRHNLMSEELKAELAKELGVYDTVKTEGWGSVSSRNCGNLVRLAIEKAEKSMVQNKKS
jgi:small acid-soluble spore protein F (minor alpha/beta-type SASP)